MIESMQTEFGELVRRRKDERGLKSYELAKAMQRAPSLVSRLENGDFKETPAADVLADLERVLGIKQHELLRTLGYDVGPPDSTESPGNPQIERLVELLRQADLDAKERWWFGDLLRSMRKANRAGAPE
jgi:transcriptional regulator with XRE-family HTH domain